MQNVIHIQQCILSTSKTSIKKAILHTVAPSECVFSGRLCPANSSWQLEVSPCQLYLQGSGPTPLQGNCSALPTPLSGFKPFPQECYRGSRCVRGRKRKRESVRECRSSCSSKLILTTCQCCQCKLSSAQQLRDTSTLHQDSSWTTVRAICYITLVWDSKPLLPAQSWCFYTYSLYMYSCIQNSLSSQHLL